jgi:hypothetical protein
MEICISQLLEEDMFQYSHSKMEGGERAGEETWGAAMKGPRPLLTTPEQFAEFRDFVQSSGGWTRKEIDSWDENELQALFLQWIAGDTRESPAKIEGVNLYEREGKWFFDHESSPDMETGEFDSRSEAYHAAASAHYRQGCYPTADALDEIDWDEYEIMSQAGCISSRLFKGSDGKIYFYIGN